MYLPEVPVPAEFCIILFHEFQFPPLEAPLGPVVELYMSKIKRKSEFSILPKWY